MGRSWDGDVDDGVGFGSVAGGGGVGSEGGGVLPCLSCGRIYTSLAPLR